MRRRASANAPMRSGNEPRKCAIIHRRIGSKSEKGNRHFDQLLRSRTDVLLPFAVMPRLGFSMSAKWSNRHRNSAAEAIFTAHLSAQSQFIHASNCTFQLDKRPPFPRWLLSVLWDVSLSPYRWKLSRNIESYHLAQSWAETLSDQTLSSTPENEIGWPNVESHPSKDSSDLTLIHHWKGSWLTRNWATSLKKDSVRPNAERHY